MNYTTLNQQLQAFLERPNLSPHTRTKYRSRLTPFVEQHSHLSPTQITTNHLLTHINNHPHLADPSKAILRSCFKAFFSYCQATPNPANALPHYRETPRRINIPKEKNVKLALDHALHLCQSDNIIQLRDGLIFALAVFSGGRRGEMANLPMDDLLEALKTNQTIYHIYTHGKTGEAILRFNHLLANHLRRYCNLRPQSSCNRVFINLNPQHTQYLQPLSLTAFNRICQKICKQAEVPTIPFQHLRRRLATKVAEEWGVETAAHALNHSPQSGDRVIRGHYYDPDKQKVDRITNIIFEELYNEPKG